MNFRTLNLNGRLEPGEVAQLCELFVSGVSITDLQKIFNMHNDKIYEYLNIYYYGMVPKQHQLLVTVQSKMNQDDP